MSCTLLDRKPLLGAILLGLTGTMVYRRSGGLGETRPTCAPYLEVPGTEPMYFVARLRPGKGLASACQRRLEILQNNPNRYFE